MRSTEVACGAAGATIGRASPSPADRVARRACWLIGVSCCRGRIAMPVTGKLAGRGLAGGTG